MTVYLRCFLPAFLPPKLQHTKRAFPSSASATLLAGSWPLAAAGAAFVVVDATCAEDVAELPAGQAVEALPDAACAA